MKTLTCPVCKKSFAKKDNPFFPFCSEQCRLIDLGNWLDGKYAVREETPQTPPSEPD
ncbi:MAG: DNA gyrase inhibitor YacG [Nitrospinales bacterium]